MLEKIIKIHIFMVTSLAMLILTGNFQGATINTVERVRSNNVNFVSANFTDQSTRKYNKRKITPPRNEVSDYCFCDKNQSLDFKEFWSFSQIESYLQYIADTYPKRATLSSLGTTVENRTLYLMKIGVELDGNNIVFVNAGMYAKEWNSIMMALYIIHVLVECDLYERIGIIDWMVMPIVNPDGYVYSFTNPKHRMWIKNRKPCNNEDDRARCLEGQDCGVNIDKNFQYMFPASVGKSRNPCSDFYPGTVDGSEIESNRTMDILYSVKKRIKLYLPLRTRGSLIIYPFAADVKVIVDNLQDMIDLAKLAADAMNKRTSSKQLYSFGSYATTIVPETGMSLDYVKGTLQVPYAYYIYLRGSHQPLPNEILPIVSECFYGICAMVSYICDKYPPPKNFLRKWKGLRRRRGRKSASKNKTFSYTTFAAVIGVYYYVGT